VIDRQIGNTVTAGKCEEIRKIPPIQFTNNSSIRMKIRSTAKHNPELRKWNVAYSASINSVVTISEKTHTALSYL
jgi:hypothetical protein